MNPNSSKTAITLTGGDIVVASEMPLPQPCHVGQALEVRLTNVAIGSPVLKYVAFQEDDHLLWKKVSHRRTPNADRTVAPSARVLLSPLGVALEATEDRHVPPLKPRCEICEQPVADAGNHYVQTAKKGRRPHQDGYWSCHTDLGKWRCAVCKHVWTPKSVRSDTLPACLNCEESIDVFPADDGVWEQVSKERDQRACEFGEYDV